MHYIAPIIFEAAWKASIIPFSSEATLYALEGFQPELAKTLFPFAIAGGLIGHTFNYLFGYYLYQYVAARKKFVTSDRFVGWRNFFTRYASWLLLPLCWGVLCNFFVVIAGLFGVSKPRTAALVMIGVSAYYSAWLWL